MNQEEENRHCAMKVLRLSNIEWIIPTIICSKKDVCLEIDLIIGIKIQSDFFYMFFYWYLNNIKLKSKDYNHIKMVMVLLTVLNVFPSENERFPER
jgi:hypothetical protein